MPFPARLNLFTKEEKCRCVGVFFSFVKLSALPFTEHALNLGSNAVVQVVDVDT